MAKTPLINQSQIQLENQLKTPEKSLKETEIVKGKFKIGAREFDIDRLKKIFDFNKNSDQLYFTQEKTGLFAFRLKSDAQNRQTKVDPKRNVVTVTRQEVLNA